MIAFNLARAAGVAASTSHARARWATLRAQLIAVPGRVASSARRLTLHLPLDLPWNTPGRPFHHRVRHHQATHSGRS